MNQIIPGGIMINLDQPSYRPGDVIKGNVFINMSQSFSTSHLELTLRVEQYTKFIESFADEIKKGKIKKFVKGITGDKLNLKLKEYREGDKILFDSSVVITKFPSDLIAPGQYQFPFNFILPMNLPGSFEYYDATNTAYTLYTLEAKLPTLNSKNVIKNQTLLIVNQSHNSLNIANQKTNSSNLTTWCCMRRGFSVLKVTIPKASFLTSDTIIAECELDNRNTSLDCINIKVSLLQKISLKDNFGRIKLLERKITELSYKNLYRNGEISKLTLELPVLDYNNPTLKFLDKCDHKFLLKNGELVSQLQASVKSDLIECSYELKIKTFYDATMFGINTPGVEIPIAIHIPDVRIDIDQFKPKDWNPNVLPVHSLTFVLPTAEELGIVENKIVIVEDNPKVIEINDPHISQPVIVSCMERI